jgi:plastocyanin
MRGVRGGSSLLSAALLLGAICLLPAVSAAQDAAAPSDTTTTTTTSEPPPPPPPSEPVREESTAPASEAPATQTTGSEKQSAPEDSARSGPVTTRQANGGKAGPRAAGPAQTSASGTVTMGDNFFSPSSITISAGDVVTWRNNGKAPHTATADDASFDTGTVFAGERASRTFSQAGTFSYICTIHPEMRGTVRVTGNGGGGASGSTPGPSEAEAVASPDAGGDKNTLPASGMAAGALVLIGLALLASGLLVRQWGLKTAVGRQLTLF